MVYIIYVKIIFYYKGALQLLEAAFRKSRAKTFERLKTLSSGMVYIIYVKIIFYYKRALQLLEAAFRKSRAKMQDLINFFQNLIKIYLKYFN
jgi:hypothetical protein